MNDDIGETLIILACIGIIFSIGVLTGTAVNEKYIRGEAIEANVAQWTIDPKTGEKDFVFKECGE